LACGHAVGSPSSSRFRPSGALSAAYYRGRLTHRLQFPWCIRYKLRPQRAVTSLDALINSGANRHYKTTFMCKLMHTLTCRLHTRFEMLKIARQRVGWATKGSYTNVLSQREQRLSALSNIPCVNRRTVSFASGLPTRRNRVVVVI